MSLDDRTLVKQMQHHDSKLAFTQLYERYSRSVYVLCLCYLKNSEAAEDALQDIFFKIWEKRQTKNETTPFKHFLFTIAKNHLLNLLKSQHYHENVEDYADSLSDDDDGKEKKVWKEKQLEDLQRAISQLSPQKQKVVQMKLKNRSSNRHIAEKLHISIYTVKSLYTSALHDLRKKIGRPLFFLW